MGTRGPSGSGERTTALPMAWPSRATKRSGVLAGTSRAHRSWPRGRPRGGRWRAGAGALGPRWDAWTWRPLAAPLQPPGRRWRWGRRRLRAPTELPAYVGLAPPGTGRETIVQVAGSRWPVEQCVAAAKGAGGLEQ